MPGPLVIIAGAVGVIAMTLGLFPPGNTALRRASYNLIPNELPGIGDLAEMRHRGIIDPQTYLDNCESNGFNTDWSERFFQRTHTLLGAYDVITAERRGIIPADQASAELTRLGFDADRQAVMRKVTLFYPSAQDLILWQAREVFEPDSVERYGLLDEVNLLEREPFYKAGIDDTQIENYWKAHWQHPSWNQVTEMLFRGVLNMDKSMPSPPTSPEQWEQRTAEGFEAIYDYYRLVEVPPFWRDRMTHITHTPLTRVDVRRMFRLGVLDENGVYTAYRILGYDDTNARLMVEFTIKYESGEDVGLTRASIISAYKMGMVTDDELPDYLKRLDYAPAVVDFWVSMAQYEKAQEIIDEAVTDLRERMEVGDISWDDFQAELTRMDLPESYLQSILDKEQRNIAKQRKIPTPTDLRDWLVLGIIDESYFTSQLRLRHYKDDDIQHYLEEINLTRDTGERKYLAISVYQRWLGKDIMDITDFETVAKEMGYSEDDITGLIAEVKGVGSE